MKAGARGGLQYHHKKDEAGYMISGEMLVRYDDGTGELQERTVKPGDSFVFPVGCVHQTEAITECVYVEVSTPFLNDRVHVESEYGIPVEAGGLPSTRIEDVVAL